MRRAVKTAAERLIVSSGALSLWRARLRDRALVLAYHNIVADDADVPGDRSLHLQRRHFVEQLDLLARTHDVMPLESLLSQARMSDRPAVAITFDDAYEGALTIGIDEVRQRGFSATVFVTPALLGTVTWWDVLGARFGGEIPEAIRKRALTLHRGDRTAVLASEAGDPDRAREHRLPRIGTEEQVLAVARLDGISLAAHTWSHRNLAALDGADLEQELAAPMTWLAERDLSTTLISYPYGLHSADARARASACGYSAGFRVEGGWMNRSEAADRFALPRYNVPAGLSAQGFAIRLAGLGAG